MIIFLILGCLFISLVSFGLGVTMGYLVAQNERLKLENMRWNLVNQVYSEPPDYPLVRSDSNHTKL